MMKTRLLHSVVEILLIVGISAVAGITWNRALITSAWRGELTRQAQAQAQAPAGEELPMPIALPQVKEMLDAKQAVLLDARSAASFRDGHIAGALPVPLEEAKNNPSAPMLSRVGKDSTIIAYCNGFSCHDSMELGKILMRAGYSSVYVFEGGFPEWRDAGYATATGGI